MKVPEMHQTPFTIYMVELVGEKGYLLNMHVPLKNLDSVLEVEVVVDAIDMTEAQEEIIEISNEDNLEEVIIDFLYTTYPPDVTLGI